jgi:hypothetical protein
MSRRAPVWVIVVAIVLAPIWLPLAALGIVLWIFGDALFTVALGILVEVAKALGREEFAESLIAWRPEIGWDD